MLFMEFDSEHWTLNRDFPNVFAFAHDNVYIFHKVNGTHVSQ